jgi:hypothetical protein
MITMRMGIKSLLKIMFMGLGGGIGGTLLEQRKVHITSPP